MYTDPKHLKGSDPGQVEGNVVFTYLDAFDSDANEVIDLKERYRAGGLGDVVLKKRLEDILQSLLEPIRERRARFASNLDYVHEVIKFGTDKANVITNNKLLCVKEKIRTL